MCGVFAVLHPNTLESIEIRPQKVSYQHQIDTTMLFTMFLGPTEMTMTSDKASSVQCDTFVLIYIRAPFAVGFAWCEESLFLSGYTMVMCFEDWLPATGCMRKFAGLHSALARRVQSSCQPILRACIRRLQHAAPQC